MNPENYASLEASKRLVEAGIVLETDALWMNYPRNPNGTDWYWTLTIATRRCPPTENCIPAPTMVEMWRELPVHTIAKLLLSGTEVYVGDTFFENRNPTDALIDLLIYINGNIADMGGGKGGGG